MKKYLRFTLTMNFFSLFCNEPEISNLERRKKLALSNYCAQEVFLNSTDNQKMKRVMLEHSQEYLRDVWESEPLNKNRDANGWDIVLIRTKNGDLKALLVSKLSEYSLTHNVLKEIKDDFKL